MRACTVKALDELGAADIDPDTPVRQLTIAQQQLVEIARALVSDPRVVIMDEPTSSLTQADTKCLFQVIRKLKARGVSVIYISHFLEECQSIGDRFTVLRDGKMVGNGDMDEASLDEIVHLMVGREVNDIYAVPPHEFGACVLQVSELTGAKKPQGVTLDVRAGEIFGLAGLVGAGRTETLRVLFGLDVCRGGSVDRPDRSVSGTRPHHRLSDGIGLLSENRKEEGLLLNRSVADNLTLSDYKPLSRWGWISDRKQHETTERWIEEMGVKTQGPKQAIGELSGGNQQKVAIARLLHHGTEVLLLDEPTRGIDVASKQQIYQLMGHLAAKGKAVLFVSSYLPELLGVCDTIGVMRRGRLVTVKPASEWTEHAIMIAATGAEESRIPEESL
jgi:ribose transport system ATP-binding protein